MSKLLSAVGGAVAATAFWGMVGLSGQSHGQSATEKLPPGVVARVNDFTISAEDILARLNEVEKANTGKGQFIRPAYSYLMYLEVLRAEAKRLGVTTTEEERRELTRQQVDAAKAELHRRHAGQVPWERFVKEMGHTPESFEAYVYDRTEQVLLKRRLIWHWEYSCPGVGYLQFISRSEAGATKVRDEMVVKLEAVRKRIAARPAPPPGEPTPRSLMWPPGTEFANVELKEEFWAIAQIKSESKRDIVHDSWLDAPLVEPVHTMLYETLKPGEISEVVRINDDMYVVVFLDRKSPGSKEPFANLKEMLDARTDPNESQYQRWVMAVLRGSRYHLEYRIPGEPDRKVLDAEGNETGKDGGNKAGSDAAKPDGEPQPSKNPEGPAPNSGTGK